jgi:hypothetical protein
MKIDLTMRIDLTTREKILWVLVPGEIRGACPAPLLPQNAPHFPA